MASNTSTRQVADPTPPAKASWIEKNPGVCGGDACIRRTRISVWGLVAYRRLGVSDAELLKNFPGLTQADLDLAWEYARANPAEIEQAIAENDREAD